MAELQPDAQAEHGWIWTGIIVAIAIIVTAIAVLHATRDPRTDDAEVFANYIGLAPQVDGPIVTLAVRDNQYVKKGDLLFAIDDSPYQYALQKALSQQATLEGQIVDKERTIASQKSAVRAATAEVRSTGASSATSKSTIDESQASVSDAQAALRRAKADLQYAINNLHRLEPLLAEQYVTVDQVDQARTLVETRTRAVEQMAAELDLSRQKVTSNAFRYQQSEAMVAQREAQEEQAQNAVETLEPLVNQREEMAAAVRLARYNLRNCHVYAPYDARVTNLTISDGQYVHTGTQVFTMIDTRTWWVVANFRETQLQHVVEGSPVDVFLMAHLNTPLQGVVESIGYGVTPDPSVAGSVAPGLPAVGRTLSWVHLAARYPVRIRVVAPPPAMLRIGQTAVTVIHPDRGGN